LLLKAFTLLVVLVLLWRDNIIDSFHSCCTIETLSAELLNSFKKQEVRVINIRTVVNVAHLFVIVGAAWEAVTRTARKRVSFSARDWGLNQQCTENLLQ
jgi:ABC-type spermidine/putrescine transport system permease subunit II